MVNFTLKRDNVLLRFFRLAGILALVSINAFVFLSDYNFSALKNINEFVSHANAQHSINETPYTLHLVFRSAPGNIMDTSPQFPVALPQFTPAALWSVVLTTLITFFCFCFFRGEENMNLQFFPGVLIPPPKQFRH